MYLATTVRIYANISKIIYSKFGKIILLIIINRKLLIAKIHCLKIKTATCRLYVIITMDGTKKILRIKVWPYENSGAKMVKIFSGQKFQL